MRTIIVLALLLLAVPAAAQTEHQTLFRASMVAAMAAHGSDLASTEHCLGAKTCLEQNKFLARFDQPAAFGAAKMGLAAVQLWLVAKFNDRGWTKAAIAVNLATTAAFTGIAIHNSRVSQ